MITRAESLAKASKMLMLEEPFYGMFLIMLNKVWTESVKTAGVSKNNINYQLSLSETFWDGLCQLHRKGLLKHELMHIAFFHLTDFEDLSNKKIANIAMDIEINQYIKDSDLPEGGVVLSLFPELKLEPYKGTRYYYEKLLEANKNNSSAALSNILAAMCSGSPTFDKGDGSIGNTPDHSTWDEFDQLDEATQKLLKSQTEHLLRQVADNIVKNRGTIPGELAEIIKRINEIPEPKFNWRGYLRRFAGGSTSVFTKKSRRKQNVRFEDNPGIRVKPKRRILVGVDTSGSVSTEELREFLNEIHHISKTGTDVIIAQCDSAISYIGPYKPLEDFEVHGRGGTSFEPVCDYYNENTHKFSCLIYLTDGEAPAPDPCRGPVLWVISSKAKDNPRLPGFRIKLN